MARRNAGRRNNNGGHRGHMMFRRRGRVRRVGVSPRLALHGLVFDRGGRSETHALLCVRGRMRARKDWPTPEHFRPITSLDHKNPQI